MVKPSNVDVTFINAYVLVLAIERRLRGLIILYVLLGIGKRRTAFQKQGTCTVALVTPEAASGSTVVGVWTIPSQWRVVKAKGCGSEGLWK